ncbi:MAG: S8 family serine peptidase [Lachnospiraceae bacterium]|nr:S8 family serine peptidase [Lachnospiraceae bacterium]
MDDQKIENQLNLALDMSDEQRVKSSSLNTGYAPGSNTWTLIVKYNGDILKYSDAGIEIVTLYNQYAIVTIKEFLIDAFAALPEIEYVEKPKRLYFADYFAKTASCITSAYIRYPGLSGRGILIAIIDSGIDFFHRDFRNADGTTRIISYWDQTVSGRPPAGYNTGTEFTEEELNEILSADDAFNPANTALSQDREADRSTVAEIMPPDSNAGGRTSYSMPSPDVEAHGTAVAGIAAGNGSSSNGRFTGVAFESRIIAVKLGFSGANSFPRTSELMQAINYCYNIALNRNQPMVVNLSFGNNYGGHDGTTLLERYIDDISGLGRSCIVVGTGNEGSSATHAQVELSANPLEAYEVEFSVGAFQPSLNIQIWKAFVDDVSISLYTPSGVRLGPFIPQSTAIRYTLSDFSIMVYYGMPAPYSTSQEIFLDFIPDNTFIESGIYRFVITPVNIVNGRIDMWMPSAVTLNNSTRFLSPSPYTTLTIPSTASDAVTVAAYNSNNFTYADFSGRGFTRYGFAKPDIAAPGVSITACAPNGSYQEVSGTSFATPFVSGSIALMMQWGIIDGNDPYLYGDKIKAYLHKGARPFALTSDYPNERSGYGALCLNESLP